jgi:hypothetical protein
MTQVPRHSVLGREAVVLREVETELAAKKFYEAVHRLSTIDAEAAKKLALGVMRQHQLTEATDARLFRLYADLISPAKSDVKA